MSEAPFIIVDTISDVAYLTLNRPDKSNALNEGFIASFTHHLLEIKNNKNIRILVIQANGKNFCAGADLKWMKESIDLSKEENLKDVKGLSDLLNILFNFPIPTVASVQGACFGGALGIIAAIDIVISDINAKFCFSEVKLGLIPAVISPYVNFAIGSKNLRQLFITAQRFNAEKAKEIGLIADIYEESKIDNELNKLISNLKENDSYAMLKVKELSKSIYNASISEDLINYTINEIAEIRTNSSTQDRLNKFLNKK